MSGMPPIAPYPWPTRESLPTNSVQWTPDPRRAVLLIHDMQRYFVNALPDELRAALVHHLVPLRRRCAALGVPVAYTAQPGRMTSRQRGLLRDFWGPGMRTDPADQQVVAELAPGPDDWRLTKWRYSAFFRSDLLDRMHRAGRDQLVLCGVYAHVGVLSTALDAFTHDIEVFLPADAVADFCEADHQLALRHVARRCGMVVLAEDVFG